jgi:hypothetical protein
LSHKARIMFRHVGTRDRQQRRKASCRNVAHTLEYFKRFAMQTSRVSNTLATISKADLVFKERSIYLSYIRKGTSQYLTEEILFTGMEKNM